MISKAFILLAGSVLLAGAHSVGDSPYAAVNQVFVPSEDSPFALNNGMANMKNGLGPSQHHHHPSNGPSKHWPHPSATWGGSGGHEDEGNTPTLSLSRSDSTPTLVLTRGGSQTPTLALTRSNGPTDKPWHKPGPSQWHHKPGPSQYHQSNDGNGVKHPYLGAEGDHSKVHKGSNAQPYVPYVQQPGSHGGAANDGNTSHDNGSGANNGGGSSGNGDMTNGNNGNGGKDHPANWGPSASARARMAEKTKQDGLYALYGQAAANACGFDAQMPGAEITACPLESGSGWDCLNLASTLESCGGCLSIGEGQDCTLIKGADSVGCVHGKCVIGTCEEGFYLDADQGACVAN